MTTYRRGQLIQCHPSTYPLGRVHDSLSLLSPHESCSISRHTFHENCNHERRLPQWKTVSSRSYDCYTLWVSRSSFAGGVIRGQSRVDASRWRGLFRSQARPADAMGLWHVLVAGPSSSPTTGLFTQTSCYRQTFIDWQGLSLLASISDWIGLKKTLPTMDIMFTGSWARAHTTMSISPATSLMRKLRTTARWWTKMR